MTTLTARFTFRGVHSLTTGVHREKTHGHQYYLEVCTQGVAAEVLRREVVSRVIERLDRQDLTNVLSPTTGEMLVEWIHDQLLNSALAGQIRSVALQETRKNRFVSARSEVLAL